MTVKNRLTDVEFLKTILPKYGFKFSKSLGQNFIINPLIPEKIAELSGADSKSLVFEVGPGVGCLSYELSLRAAKLICIELDKRLIPLLNETLADRDNIEIIEADALKVDFKELALKAGEFEKILFCANLPYNITSPMVAKLIESKLFSEIMLMLQKETAERICAREGGRNFGAFSVFVNYFCETEKLFELGSEDFMPMPKVDSAVIKLAPRKSFIVELKDPELFRATYRSAFSQRRKTLLNSMSAGELKLNKEQLKDVLNAVGLDPGQRAETVSPDSYARLSNEIYKIKER